LINPIIFGCQYRSLRSRTVAIFRWCTAKNQKTLKSFEIPGVWRSLLFNRFYYKYKTYLEELPMVSSTVSIVSTVTCWDTVCKGFAFNELLLAVELSWEALPTFVEAGFGLGALIYSILPCSKIPKQMH